MPDEIEEKAKEVLDRVERSVAAARENLLIPAWVEDKMSSGMIDNLLRRGNYGSDNFFLFLDILGKHGFTD